MRIKINENQLKSLLSFINEGEDDGIKVGQKHTFFSTPTTEKVYRDVREFILKEMIGLTDDTTYLFVKNQLLRYLNNSSTHSQIEKRVVPYFKSKGYKYPKDPSVIEYQKQLGTTSYVNYDKVEGEFVDGWMGTISILATIPILIETIQRVMKGRPRDFTYGQMRLENERNRELEAKGAMTKERKAGEVKVVDKPKQPTQKKNIGVGTQHLPKSSS